MIQRSTIQLLRFPFSLLLAPVFLFALSVVTDVNWPRTALVFAILHLLVYPSSNGYNSYMDRDETSIGAIEKPMQPTRQLFIVSIVMDIVALVLSLLVSQVFAVCVAIYIAFSRLYSYRAIRLKRYPLTGFITVALNQGSLVFFAVYHGCSSNLDVHVSWLPLMAASLLIGGFYPITQIYQHEADEADGVQTISMLLGKRGTFLFCAVVYSVAMLLLWLHYSAYNMYTSFLVLLVFFLPVVAYFTNWFLQVNKNPQAADFAHTMTMNKLATVCTGLAFLTIFLMKHFG